MFVCHSENNLQKCVLLLDNFRSKEYVLLLEDHKEGEPRIYLFYRLYHPSSKVTVYEGDIS